VVAPEVVIVQGFHAGSQRDDGGAGGVERDGFHWIAGHAGRGQGLAGRRNQSPHVVRVALRGEVGILSLPMQGVVGHARAEQAALTVYNRHPNAERSEIHSRYDGHQGLQTRHHRRSERRHCRLKPALQRGADAPRPRRTPGSGSEKTPMRASAAAA